ncbi:hypothetical protein BDY21DRAFT_325745 [Lineolata rhizophorae]|uniref:non-specific serine/threonine protein kinase n=1 Tax=Lineolata rhizophorae TaxID=578093 RepID=A0A6A6NSD8_9PEZI|nr:hypothetical protein BDY21DRAFT_325745 [Lineolata rhizophorae]
MNRNPPPQPRQRRRALGEVQPRERPPASPRHKRVSDLSSALQGLPHNQSLVPNGALSVRGSPSKATGPNGKRLSGPIPAPTYNSNRNSATSTVSPTAPRRLKTHIGPWQLGKDIGRGACSRVREVRHCYKGTIGAVKIISKATAEQLSSASLANLAKNTANEENMFASRKVMPLGLEREIVIMKLLEHQNIVRLLDVWENSNELYLIMEYVRGGELFHYIAERRGLEEMEVVFLFRQIIAALLYCDRLNIHHRDLKPENILLDKSTFEIKLVDFGMAAMQPQGRFLSTPCGSPHYAAPEVINAGLKGTRAYDGGQADIWSCGVILYVMLTGTPPFNYNGEREDLHNLFRAISKGQYVMPDGLSPEARDLIARILIPNPTHRIGIEAIWNHPFLHKYDEEFGIDAKSAAIEHWIGPGPHIENWKPLQRHEIDREILRNMRTLWHSEKEEVLIQNLLNDELNHEKYFYSALIKHRNEIMEDYAGLPAGVGYSPSDYHHIPGRSRAATRRSQSQYSILQENPVTSKQSLLPPQSEASYDPFRASKEPLVDSKADYTNVTIHRGTSSASRKTKFRSQRQQGSLRVETLKNRKGGSQLSRSTSRKSSPGQRSEGTRRTTQSRSSISSSTGGNASSIMVRPSSIHKRGVSFAHLRKTSAGSGPGPDTPSPKQTVPLSRRRGDPNFDSRASPQRPSMRPAEALRSKKEGGRDNNAKYSRAVVPNPYIENEARKVSTELEKVCEEAFFRTSIGSSARTSITDRPTPYETPPSSVSNQESGYAAKEAARIQARGDSRQRPLPPIPNDQANPTARELLDMRERLATRLACNRGTAEEEHLRKILAELDRLVRQPPPPSVDNGRRNVSAPDPRTTELQRDLPIISEEHRSSGVNPLSYRDEYRSATDPVGKAQPRALQKADTIRLVDPTSPPQISPLNIKKAKNLEANENSPRSASAEPSSLHTSYAGPVGSERPKTAPHQGKASTQSDSTKGSALRKKRSWFRFNKTENSSDRKGSWISDTFGSPDDRNKTATSSAQHRNRTLDRSSSASSEFPMRENARDFSGKRKFLNIFGKKRIPKKDAIGLEVASPGDLSNPSLVSTFDNVEGKEAYETVPSSRANDFQQNWFARFFHIKPATKLLCFQVGRGRARQEIVRTLKDWRRFGVKDVSFNRASNTVRARVDKDNHLKIKPVELMAELFVVLEHGRRAQLSMARFTQTRGAASSFRKAVEIIEDVLNSKGLLVEDGCKKQAMCEVLG